MPLKPRIDSRIRLATDRDLQAVLAWLEAEERAYDAGEIEERGFWCNRGVVEDALPEGELWVLAQGDEISAFAALSRSDINILEVQPGRRREGLGRTLALHCIEVFKDYGNCAVRVECTPESSVPFWQSLGFKLSARSRVSFGGPEGYLLIDHRFPLPDDGVPVEVVVRAFPESAMYSRGEEIAPAMEASPHAVRMMDGRIELERRVALHPESLGLAGSGDIVIEVVVDGRRLLKTKAKYDEAEAIGVWRDRAGTRYMEVIEPTEAPTSRDDA